MGAVVRRAEALDLREHKPHPVRVLAARPDFSQGVSVRITLRGQEAAKIVQVGVVGQLWGGH